MFERFTDQARRVLVLAQEEARLLEHAFIGTEHILLGLIHGGEGIAAEVLTSLGLSLDTVREKVREMAPPMQGERPASPPFTSEAKSVLEFSLREALQFGHTFIGTEHLALGLADEGKGLAAKVLENIGVERSHIHQAVVDRFSK